ncbi:Inosine-5'-monophosphate dehydrogenase [Altererythrobacter epoxidivorans]|uniref:Inosine-5'-monophosphate dehydrogenase n=2 Tax=Altererythrobacter epoxidivorans TaxID=361183 RepID=A0A0M3TAW7_9SPHN|nr:Inosine-5'-monophosphate dehydrogenase [Altererythrobacter epoxidivorans]
MALSFAVQSAKNAILRAKKRICISMSLKHVKTAVAIHPCSAHLARMTRKSPLDDPENAAHAWARYRRVMRLMFLITLGTVGIAVALLYKHNGAVSVHYYIATALGVGFTMLLASALMGLMFLSNGTGHDESVDNRLPGHDED